MQTPIHIQHVVLSLQPGGLENGVVNVVNRLATARFRSSVCCLKQTGQFALRLDPGIPIHDMAWRGGNDPWLPFRLARLFRKTRTDVVHTRNAESFYYGFLGAKLAGVRTIVHSEHGRTFDDRAIRFWVQRWFSRHTQVVFAVSAQLQRELALHVGIPQHRIAVLHNGVDLARFAPGERRALLGALGLASSTLLIGSVGRLARVKNQALLLTALAAPAVQECANWVALVVGEGPERAALEARARSLGIAGRVRFLGQRDDVAALLAALDIFVLPSLSEGISNTLLEAMASGVACIASAVGGNVELLDDGVHGHLFASGEAPALAGHLQRLCLDAPLRRRLGQAARARMVREFSMEAMIARYEALYQASTLLRRPAYREAL